MPETLLPLLPPVKHPIDRLYDPRPKTDRKRFEQEDTKGTENSNAILVAFCSVARTPLSLLSPVKNPIRPDPAAFEQEDTKGTEINPNRFSSFLCPAVETPLPLLSHLNHPIERLRKPGQENDLKRFEQEGTKGTEKSIMIVGFFVPRPGLRCLCCLL